MRPQSNIEKQLSTLIRMIDRPAMLVNLRERRIIVSNEVALARYSSRIDRGTEIRFDNLDFNHHTSSYFALAEHPPPLCLIQCSEESAIFQTIPFSRRLALILDVHNMDADTPRSGLLDQFPVDSTNLVPARRSGGFNVNYTYDLVSGVRTYSELEALKSFRVLSKNFHKKSLDWHQYIVEEDLPSLLKSFEKCVKYGGDMKVSYRVRTKDGNVILIDDSFGLIKLENNWPLISGCIVTGRYSVPIDPRIQRLALSGRLVGSMIHDFKNLLTGIQNIIEWCITQTPSGSVVHNALRKTVNYADLSNSLISSTMRIIGGKGEDHDWEIMNIGELLIEIEELIRHIMSEAITVQVSVEPDLPAVWGNRSIFQDMILNLTINARDAMKTVGNKLTIQCFQVDVDSLSQDEQRYISVRVQDNGCGLPKEQKKSIFDSYYSTKKEGVGLGLWMVKESVRYFGGTIDVDSKKNSGTTFEIRLPVSKSVEGQKKRKKRVADSRNSTLDIKPFENAADKTILLVEDEPLIRNGLTTWFESFGFRLYTADNGKVGWELFERFADEIDLVIQDFILPGKRGEELLADITRMCPTIPVIIISAFAEGQDNQRIIEKGAYAFLPKPFKIESLATLLHKVFD